MHPSVESLAAEVAGPLARVARSPFLVLVVIAAIAWFTLEFRRSLGRRSEAATSDRGSGLVINAAVIAGFAVAIIAARALPGAAIRPQVLAVTLGLVCLLCGIALRLWSFRTLGRYFTFQVQTSTDQPVITSGPYRVLRHPSYTGVLLIVVGVGCLFANWASVASISALVTTGLVYRIRVEERALLDALGEAYRGYAATHRRLVPLIW